jgi:hypothetical protein
MASLCQAMAPTRLRHDTNYLAAVPIAILGGTGRVMPQDQPGSASASVFISHRCGTHYVAALRLHGLGIKQHEACAAQGTNTSTGSQSGL